MHVQKPRPYVGITGFTDREQVQTLSRYAHMNDGRLFMVGLLMSSKTLRGESNKWPNRFPTSENMGNIFTDSIGVLNMIHFHADKDRNLGAEMEAALYRVGRRTDGFQLNMVWPDVKQIQRVKAIYPHLKIVIQVGERSFRSVQNSPRELAAKLKREYSDVADYVLFDMSGGTGKDLDLSLTGRCLSEIREKLPNVGLVAAGGLCGENIADILPLIRKIPDLSFDAEGKLMDSEGRLGIGRGISYLLNSDKMLKQVRA
jgi:hypothetical protein